MPKIEAVQMLCSPELNMERNFIISGPDAPSGPCLNTEESQNNMVFLLIITIILSEF